MVDITTIWFMGEIVQYLCSNLFLLGLPLFQQPNKCKYIIYTFKTWIDIFTTITEVHNNIFRVFFHFWRYNLWNMDYRRYATDSSNFPFSFIIFISQHTKQGHCTFWLLFEERERRKIKCSTPSMSWMACHILFALV